MGPGEEALVLHQAGKGLRGPPPAFRRCRLRHGLEARPGWCSPWRRIAVRIAACSWQVNGYWTWTAVHGHGHASLPYDCHAGLSNWHTGWSPGKKAQLFSRETQSPETRAVQGWCCANGHAGCEGSALSGGGAAGGAAGAPKGSHEISLAATRNTPKVVLGWKFGFNSVRTARDLKLNHS